MLGGRRSIGSMVLVWSVGACSEQAPADARCYSDSRLDTAFTSAEVPVEIEQALARLAVAMTGQEVQHLRQLCWDVSANEILSDPVVRKGLDVVSPYAASSCETEESRFRGMVDPQACLGSPNCAAWIDFILNRLGQRVRFNNDGTIDSCDRAQDPGLCVAYILSVLKSEMDSTMPGVGGSDDGAVTAAGSASDGPATLTGAGSADEAGDDDGGGCDPADVFELSGIGSGSGATETVRVSTAISGAFFGAYSCEPNCDVVFDAVFTLNADGTGSWNNSMASNRSFRWGVSVDETCNVVVTEGVDDTDGPYQLRVLNYVYTSGDETGILYGGQLGIDGTRVVVLPYFSKGCGSDCYDP